MFHDNILLVILIVKKLLERFAKIKCKKKKRKKSQKVSMRKGDKLNVIWKSYGKCFSSPIDEKTSLT